MSQVHVHARRGPCRWLLSFGIAVLLAPAAGGCPGGHVPPGGRERDARADASVAVDVMDSGSYRPDAASASRDGRTGRDAQPGEDGALARDAALAPDGTSDAAVRDAVVEDASDAASPPAITRLTVMDHFEAFGGGDQYDTEIRWENRDLSYHGEAVAQSAIYGYAFMAEAAGVADLAPGNSWVAIERVPTSVPSGVDWLAHMEAEVEAAYARGSRLFNMSFGSVADATPAFDGWLDAFAREKAIQGDPILIFIGAGNDPRNLSTMDDPPDGFGQLKFFPNYLADETRPWWIQVTGLEDDLSQVRWTGYESTFSDHWPVDVAASVKLWAFDATGNPYWWGNRVGTSFSAPIAAGVFLFLQAYLRHEGLNPDVSELRDAVLEDGVTRPFSVGGTTFGFPVVEVHSQDEYTNWAEQGPYALDPSLGIVCMFDDVLDQWVYATVQPNGTPTGPDVVKEIVRRGVLTPDNASVVLEAVAEHFGLVR